MNAALEFHDSEVSLVEGVSGTLRLLFSVAYIHRSEGRPGVDSGSGYIQPAEIIFYGASWEGLSSACKGVLSDGSVTLGSESLSLIPLPFTASGPLSAKLVFASGPILLVSATSAACSCSGDPKFVETYPG